MNLIAADQPRTMTDSTILAATEAGLAAVVVLGIPVALYAVGLAPVERLAYPAVGFIAAGYLYSKRSPWYVGLCIWLFCATPLVRRLVDEQAGWDPSNPVLLTPYLACAFAGLSFVRYLLRPRPPHVTPFVIVLGCIVYGLLLAILNGRLLSGMIDAMKWSAGPLVAVHILAQSRHRGRLRQCAENSLLVAGPLMAAYGIAQYINPQSWDADWVTEVASLGLNSIGVPRPFELRVFGTMNSPGSLGAILMVSILIALQRRLVAMLPAISVMILGLLLTQYRAIWAGTLLGTLYLVYGSLTRVRVYIAISAVGLMGMTSLAAVMPEVRQAVTQRLLTITELQGDASGEDRLHQYQTFLLGTNGNNLLAGEGLAIDGASRRLDHQNSVVVDSGLIESYNELGVFVGTLFMAGILGATCLPFARKSRNDASIPLCRAVALALICQLPFGSVYGGEFGFCGWLFFGFAAAVLAGCQHTSHLGLNKEDPFMIV